MDLASVLLKHRLITGEQAEMLARAPLVRMDQVVGEPNLATEDKVLQALASEFGMELVDLSRVIVDRELL